ncbi:MAG: 16S rRNA (cytosine(1402)-N(4))-methyltransferase RsmH [Desulfovibrio sp.]|nr:16S rRNA (cytosine(1402)-N(4))-methyltransferase RsmH [Desulfovibrio sp.]MCA1985022.1 16S rRNA (cytosine(1402)-N(4))-methyltransferase RsmH [Desulfovibrio sp.]
MTDSATMQGLSGQTVVGHAGPAQETPRHASVLVQEVLALLEPRPGGRYLDGTLGLGGHAHAMLDAVRAQGGRAELLGMDRDPQALALARARLAEFGDAVHLVHAPFSEFEDALDAAGWDALDGALLDVGVSSLQLDDPARGFSFLHDGPLDMRMNQQAEEPSALQLVNRAEFEALKEIILDLGEEPLAGKIARAIVARRDKAPFETTADLAEVVSLAYPPQRRRTARNHPATRTFQGLRMAVNRELEELGFFLKRIVPRLKVGGRVAIISFHSLEDRLVKQAFREQAAGCDCGRTPPWCRCGKTPAVKILTKKPVVPGEAEQAANSRARSAKLRAAERLSRPGTASR